jgi:hypothetical protein
MMSIKDIFFRPVWMIFAFLVVIFVFMFANGCGDGSLGEINGRGIQWLFVQNAHSVSLNDGVLRLNGVSPTTVFFSDRPKRLAAHGLTSEFVTFWSTGGGSDNFSQDPPNATLAIVSEGEAEDVVLTLSNPRLDEDILTYDVTVLEGRERLEAGPASLFIDIIGMPLTPISYAGAARRIDRRRVYRADMHYR